MTETPLPAGRSLQNLVRPCCCVGVSELRLLGVSCMQAELDLALADRWPMLFRHSLSEVENA
jgi:hypothetical protein